MRVEVKRKEKKRAKWWRNFYGVNAGGKKKGGLAYLVFFLLDKFLGLFAWRLFWLWLYSAVQQLPRVRVAIINSLFDYECVPHIYVYVLEIIEAPIILHSSFPHLDKKLVMNNVSNATTRNNVGLK